MTSPAARFTGTYRLQLHSGFTLDDARATVPYLAELGVSHVYLAPILGTVQRSLHGYDVLDHSTINPDLGGRAALDRLAADCHRHGLGIVVDIVPNHMALTAPQWRNAPLWDVLRHGRGSSFAQWFDVDWDHLQGRFGLPILGAPVSNELDALRVDVGGADEGPAAGQRVLRYYDHLLPLRPDGPRTDSLTELLDAQHWLLASHTEAADVLNYRRFFEVDSLVAIRVEEPDVFDATHALLLELHHAGIIDAFRVDHPDGLADPAGYLSRLTAACRDDTPIWVEKILEGDERLPGWACHGTTGYDAAAVIDTALVDPATAGAVTGAWSATGGEPSLHTVVQNSKRQVLDQLMQPELNRLHRAATAAVPALDVGALREALAELLVQLHVYRAYVTPGAPSDPALVAPLHEALDHVRTGRPDLAAAASEIAGVLVRPETATGDTDAARDLCVRFQQTTGPVMAKGIEDTAFYRWHRLAALNEVGFDPATGEHPGVAELHAWAAHQATHWPLGMTTLSTHDTKRSEDVRARLLALAGDADSWTSISALAAKAAQRHGVDAPTGHLVWQTLAGAGRISPERLDAYLVKALREGKQQTSWMRPDPDYEQRVLALGREILAGGVVGEAIATALRANADAIRTVTLAQKLLQLTLPGVPDTYQGACRLNLTLVDPDNRADVDFGQHRARLTRLDENHGFAPVELVETDRISTGSTNGEGVSTRSTDGGGISTRSTDLDDEVMLVTSRTLRLRRRRPDDFAGGYRPLDLGEELIGFQRGEDVLSIVRRLPRSPADSEVRVPPGRWTDAFTGATHQGSTTALFASLPVALLVRQP